jgi:hypothetical protein
MNLRSAWLWPDVSNRRFAQNAIQEASWAAIFVSFLGAIATSIGFLFPSEDGVGYLTVVSCVTYAGLAFGIYRRSRIAAISAFVLFTNSAILYWATAGPKGVFFRLLFGLAFLHGARGSIAYHKLPPRPANLPTLAESFRAVNQSPSRQDERNT